MEQVGLGTIFIGNRPIMCLMQKTDAENVVVAVQRHACLRVPKWSKSWRHMEHDAALTAQIKKHVFRARVQMGVIAICGPHI